MSDLNLFGCLLIAVDLALLLILLLRPLSAARHDDAGDGFNTVVLPRPKPVTLRRLGAFYALSLSFAALLASVRPGPASFYRALVDRLALLALNRPNEIASAAGRVDAAMRLVMFVNIIAVACVLRASPGRRLAVAWNAVIFAATVASIDAAGLVVSSLARLSTAAAALVTSLLVIAVAIVVMMRILGTAFALPRPCRIPQLGGRLRLANTYLAGAVLVSVTLVVVLLDVFEHTVARNHGVGFLALFVGLPLIYNGVLLVLFVTLPRPPRPVSAERPPITVITPAFNEEPVIAVTLRSLDRAAARYGGAVTVLLIDDGSTDRTFEIATETMAGFRAARGRILSPGHQGKALALNAGLDVTETDIVVRVDADVTIAPDAFVHLPGWFEDAEVGLVGALDLPNPDLTSWYARGRLFECMIAFGFVRLALQRIDAVSCIPGTFMAMRTAPARAAGGFVTGMNGEDADLTLLMGRLGYRVMLDTRIRIYEDVPGRLRDFREQRVRWSRAGIHNFTRHSPLHGGPSTPRTWFFFVRVAALRATGALRPLVFLTGLELGLLDPGSKGRIPELLLLYAASTVPNLVVISIVAVRQGFARDLKWLPLWLPFSFARRLASFEGLLTLPTRELLPGVRVAVARRADHSPVVRPIAPVNAPGLP